MKIEPFNPADLDYFPPGEPWPNGPDARAPKKPKMIIEWFGEAADSALSEPVNPLIEDLLDEGALSVIYGDSGSGKSSPLSTWHSTNLPGWTGTGKR